MHIAAGTPTLPTRRSARIWRALPGIAVLSAIVLGAFAAHRLVPSVSPLLWAIGIAVLVAPLVRSWPPAASGVQLSGKPLLRAGVALLGFQISIGQVLEVGLAGMVAAAGTVAVTMLATLWVGRRLGVPEQLTVLIAAGTAICGASAIAAMNTVVRAREAEVAYALATVTVLGTAAMLLVPLLADALRLTDAQAGMWAGASIHEVAQATAAGAAISGAALKVATLVKLIRVVMLAAVVAIVGSRDGGHAKATTVVPGFIWAFLALLALRSATTPPEEMLEVAKLASTAMLCAGLAALGLGIRPSALRAAGFRPLALAIAASVVAAATALGLVLLAT